MSSGGQFAVSPDSERCCQQTNTTGRHCREYLQPGFPLSARGRLLGFLSRSTLRGRQDAATIRPGGTMSSAAFWRRIAYDARRHCRPGALGRLTWGRDRTPARACQPLPWR
jgi:hypothetical protein